jgi:beta-lactamase superfamily II metal-dependent hydrolase
MSKIKSFSVGNGDMFYINHGSSNFTIIDCCLSEEAKEDIVDELISESNGKDITRFISTHPDDDHIRRIEYLDDRMNILNFYCVKNEATKNDDTDSFTRYCELRDSTKAFYISKGCTRKWMNQSGNDNNGKFIGSSGINILWPNTKNEFFKTELEKVKKGESPNNISPIIKYSIEDGATVLWMGDLETEFMENILNEVSFPKINILFAPHHGRKSGKVPNDWLNEMDPDIIIMGEAPSQNLDYAGYDDYNKITQNSAGDIILDCIDSKIHIYVSNENYSVDFLQNDYMADKYDCYYLGTLNI